MEQSAWFAARGVSYHSNMGCPACTRALAVKHCDCRFVDAEVRELCRFASFHGFCATLTLSPCALRRSFSTWKLSINTVESKQRDNFIHLSFFCMFELVCREKCGFERVIRTVVFLDPDHTGECPWILRHPYLQALGTD
jgi:hypothetical protein